jgi:hypothetical protein
MKRERMEGGEGWSSMAELVSNASKVSAPSQE